jgi:hypothetical protein
MKNFPLYLFSAAVIAFATYGLFAFAAWETSPGKWSEQTRTVCATVIGMLLLLTTPILLRDEGPLSNNGSDDTNADENYPYK